MSAKRGATGLRGILLVDKPAGMTSHDVVARLRRATGERRIGHAGTLDPAATGLLVMLIGPFTRLEPYLSAAEKGYVARIAFGSETDTDDAEGAVVRESAVPPDVFTTETGEAALRALTGPSEQLPPAYSAIKVGGRTAHRVARAGGELELQPRPITVHRATLLAQDADEGTWDVDFLVSKGTYVRALARDLGRAMGTAAHLAGLRRTSSGPLTLDAAHTLEAAERAAGDGLLGELFADPLLALGLPTIPGDPVAVTAGRSIVAPPDAAQRYAVVHEGTLLAIYGLRGTELRPEAVFPILEGVSA